MRLKFSECVLDLRVRQLERQGKIVPLEPKVYELLEVLISRRPAVVTNNELDELLWPQVYVARTSLTRLVSELRTALGDLPRAPRFIRTVYKTGYAFCAEVTPERSAAAAAAMIELVWRKLTVPLADGEHFAGRDAECALAIDASTVSRRHARITVASGAATIVDLESTNGTFVQGIRISGPTRLKAGDEFSLGSEIVQVRRRSASAVTVKMDDETRSAYKLRR